MKIIILAGGFGTRLREVVKDVPKPMAEICGKPFLDYQINKVRKSFPRAPIYLLTYYKSEVIEEYFKEDSLIYIIKELEPLGTGGSLKNAINVLKLSKDEEILVFNGDTYIDLNFKELIENSKYDLTLVASYQEDCSRYGSLELYDDIIISFKEKNKNCRKSYINAGCYFFKKLNILSSEETSFSLEDKFNNYIKSSKVGVYKYNDIFIDIGIPEDYQKMIDYIGNKK